MGLFGKRKTTRDLIADTTEKLSSLIEKDDKTDAVILTVTTNGKGKVDTFNNGVIKGSPETLVETLFAAAEDNDDFAKIIMTVASILKSKNPEMKRLDDAFNDAEGFINNNKQEIMKINPKNDEEVEDIIAKFLKEKGLNPDDVEIRKIKLPKSKKGGFSLDDITDDMTDKQIEDLLDQAGGISFGPNDDDDDN